MIKSIEKLNSIAYSETKKTINDKIDVIYFDATTISTLKVLLRY